MRRVAFRAGPVANALAPMLILRLELNFLVNDYITRIMPM